ncbi:glutaredoxin-related protein 5, mitochondrial-like [Convolutriloba macropyga]|uniref:glutaredoxin-related protein 5, mitochondrial-like n=1 Tax=Convolutriloba macropyga TaxID=536237 RepID=UPI003F5264FE
MIIMSLLRNLTRHTISKSPFLLSARLCSTQKLSSGLEKRLSAMVTAKDVVIFMKGVPNAPQCGFSNAVVQILKMHGVEDYDAHNVLEENELREGVKVFSNWPTIPQIYFKGEFIGGCDVLLQMHQSGEIVEELQKLGIKSKLLTQAENEAKK